MRSRAFLTTLVSLVLALPLLSALRPNDSAELEGPAATRAALRPDGRTFKVDPVHSSMMFRVKHLDVAWFYGRFNKMTGSFLLDGDHPDKSFVKVEIAANSVDTNNAGRNRDLMSPGFFAAKQFPTISFESTKVKKVGMHQFQITGDLSMRGQKKSITISAASTGSKDAGRRFGYRSGFATEFSIKRSDFGMQFGIKQGMLGDQVNVWISLEGSPQG